LVELMVALVISGILVGIIFQFLLGQTRFARLQGAREEVQQNARVAVDVISSDLRAVGRMGSLQPTPTRLTFGPLAHGDSCAGTQEVPSP
jgi:Tfp pilus assembly protein PilW